MKENPRREFLKKSLAGVAGAAFAPVAWKPALAGTPRDPAAPALPTRILGRTQLQIPLISMGCGEASGVGLIRQAYDAGVKLFFSATYYGRGNNERLAGEALRGLPRDSFLVGTAASPEGFNPREGALPKGYTAASFRKTAEEALARFGFDHVDILMLPFAAKKAFIQAEPILEALLKLKEQGKTRFLGIATHDPFEEALQAAVEAKVYDMAMVAYNYKSADGEKLRRAMAAAAASGLGLVAMKTTAGAARDKSRTTPLNTDAALKWVLREKAVASIVSGMSNESELRKNLAMVQNIAMSEQEWKDLGLESLKSEAGLYCQQCRQCLPQCPHGLDIPTLMRSYMYAYGYRNLEHARQALDSAGVTGRPCDACAVCRVECASGFDIKDRVQDIVRLGAVPPEFLKA